MSVHFFSESTDFKLEDEKRYAHWIEVVVFVHKYELINLNYIFCSDKYLLKMNKEYLNHDYYTDIVTFNNADQEFQIEGDIFISIERVKENARTHSNTFEQELERVMAHGVLHLLGFNDQTSKEKRLMREKEDSCLSLLKN